MASDTQRNRIWYGMLACANRQRYYGYLAGRFGAQARWVAGLSAFFMAAATIGFLTALSELLAIHNLGRLLAPSAGAIATTLSICMAFGRIPDKAIQSAAFQRKSEYLSTQWQLLWGKVDGMSDDEADEAWAELDRATAGSYDGASEALPVKGKLWDRCQDETTRIFKETY